MTLRRRLALTVIAAAVPLVAGAILLRDEIEVRRLDEQMREFAFAHMEAGGRERCERNAERWSFDSQRPPPRPGPPPRAGPAGDRDFGDFGPPDRGPRGDPREDRGLPGPRREPRDDGRGPRDAPPLGPPEPTDGSEPLRRPAGAPPDVPATRLWGYRGDLTSANPRAPAMPEAIAASLREGAPDAAARWESGASRGRQMAVRMSWTEGPCAVVLVQREFTTPGWLAQTYLLGIGGVVAGLLVAVLVVAGPIVRRIRALTHDVRRSAQSRYEHPVPVEGSDEIARLASAFNAAGGDVRAHLAQLGSREKTLREFVANTTHDVMIPLTVLQGHLSKLRAKARAGQPPDPEAVHDALDEAHYIACLLQNLGAAAKLEAGYGGIDRHSVDLAAIVERVVARHRPIAEGKGIALEHAVPAEPIEVLGDVTLLEQAVSNVVHNAVRYGTAGGHVAVVLERPREPAGKFLLRVLDDGPGIPDDEMPRVLERRYRGRGARTRAPDGAGLGLAITNDVVLRHGFRIALARSEAGGLEVRFEGDTEESPTDLRP